MPLLQTHFRSSVLDLCCTLNALIPPPPPNGKPRSRLRVLWLLHGRSDDHSIWLRRTSIERYAEGRQLAVIMPAVDRSFYVDAADGPRYGTFIADELPALCRWLFPLSDRRADNFVAGLSMGGYGAFRLALAHPDRYAAAASLSGALDIADFQRFSHDREHRRIFGPIRKVPGSANDLFALARTLARSGKPIPRLYQCCGSADFLYQANLRFRDHARKLGLPLTYEEHPDRAHDWGYWDQQIQRVLDWLPPRKSGGS